MNHAVTSPTTNRASVPHQSERSWSLGRWSANFWLAFMFWWVEHVPCVVWWTRGFFLMFAWRFAGTLRNNTLANARGVLGASADEAACVALAKNMIRSFYIAVYELGCAVRMSTAQLLERIDSVTGRDTYFDARRGGRGAVIVTAHLGCFELGSVALAEHEQHVHVVFRRDVFARFDRLRSKLRERLGVIEAPVDDGWGMWARLRDALARDEVVMIQGDRVMPGQKGVSVPFLGNRLLMPAGPFKLALAAGAPIIPVFSLRTSVGRLRVVVEKPIAVSRDDGPLDSRHPALLRLASVMEKHVRAHPEQWLMVEPVWATNESDGGATQRVGA